MLDFLGIGSTEKLREGKRKIRIKYFSIIEYLLLGFIIFTSFTMDVSFIILPVFLTVVFILIQIKKVITYKINRPYLTQEDIKELIKEELKKRG